MRVAASDPAAPEAVRLMAELSAVLAAITGDSGQSSFDQDDVRGPLACFALARITAATAAGEGGGGGADVHGQAVGCGAFRPLEDGVAELKRMYAQPGHPGAGSAILAFLEAEAAALGYRALRLSTRRVNARALGFYQARGYRVIPNFGRYAGRAESVCLEKAL